jgi:hypothetical protein
VIDFQNWNSPQRGKVINSPISFKEPLQTLGLYQAKNPTWVAHTVLESLKSGESRGESILAKA